MTVCAVLQVAKMLMTREHQLLPRRGEQELMTNFILDLCTHGYVRLRNAVSLMLNFEIARV